MRLNPVFKDFPNPRSNVFLMTRFKPARHHAQIRQAIENVLSEYSLNLIRADVNDYAVQVWDNVEACMNACNYGIAIFEQIDEQDINPNVSLELGFMRGQDKKCLILKEKGLTSLQADLSGYLYSDFDKDQIDETITPQIRRWLRSIGIAKRSNERLLVFVSDGGTCRCALAMAITNALLKANPPSYPLRVLSTAAGEPSLSGASPGARRAITQLFGEDLLAEHRVMRLTRPIVEEADLILAMSRAVCKTLQKVNSSSLKEGILTKIHVFKPYFGLEGDIDDPWEYRDTPEEDAMYLRTANELKSIIQSHLDEILQVLDPKL